jgi:hypothetical protein
VRTRHPPPASRRLPSPASAEGSLGRAPRAPLGTMVMPSSPGRAGGHDLAKDRSPCQQSVSTPASRGPTKQRVTSTRQCRRAGTMWCGAWSWGGSVWGPHSLHTPDVTGPFKRAVLCLHIDAHHPVVQTLGRGQTGVAHDHVSRQGPSLWLWSAGAASARLLPGPVTDAWSGSWLLAAAGAAHRRRHPSGAALARLRGRETSPRASGLTGRHRGRSA